MSVTRLTVCDQTTCRGCEHEFILTGNLRATLHTSKSVWYRSKHAWNAYVASCTSLRVNINEGLLFGHDHPIQQHLHQTSTTNKKDELNIYLRHLGQIVNKHLVNFTLTDYCT